MNYISTDLQRRIMFIPIVNFGNCFIAAINCFKSPRPAAMGFQLGIRFFCYAFPITFFWGILSAVLPQLEDLFYLCCLYSAPLFISYGLIKWQEKVLV